MTLTVEALGETELVMIRSFDAPRRLLWAALTDPDLVPRWLGAHGWQIVRCEIDLRAGGAWRYVSTGPGGAEMAHGGIFREIVPEIRLVFTESYNDQWVAGESLVTQTLDEHGNRTTLTTDITYPSREIRDVALRSPMERGVGEGYTRLDALLATLT
ncbi:SRPBCC family protein [Nonomuraea typhae]|uniref:SRPBCC family protein n=1 Tax=Nonomuraea typhae TaxID=2603600 RepID=UPI0012F8BAE0|nr:SRPBCC family protein [Nonomuraea typhae]